MKKIYKEVGKRVSFMRSIRGYTREYLAECAEISPKFLYEIENGKKGFSSLVLVKICASLQVDCDYIMTGKQVITYDQKLVHALQRFNQSQLEQITQMMEDIYDLVESEKKR